MKTRIVFSAIAAALTLFLSCQKEIIPSSDTDSDEQTVVVTPDEGQVIFSASTGAPLTRTELSDNGNDTYTVLWKAGDVINVNGKDLNLETEAQPDGYGPGHTKGRFSGAAPTPAGSSPFYKAIYPSSLRDRYGYYNLPAEQSYLAGGIVAFPMYAESDTPDLAFYNLCGIIQLNLKGSKSVSAITLADKDDTPKPMSGRFTVSGNAATLTSGVNGTTLICDSPVALNTETFTPFFITVPATDYGKLRIIIEASDGSICTLTSKSAIRVERSMITTINISSPNFKNDTASITYTTTNTTKPNIYAGGADASVFGEGLTVVSHNYDEATKTGVITLSGTVTTIGYYAFRAINNLKTVTIPNSVTSLGERSFGECSNLESVNFPRSLTTIGKQVFVNCYKFVPEDMSHISYIGEEAFMNVNITGTLTIWEGLDYLGPKAFKYAKFSEVVFDHTPAELGGYIFESSSSLTTVTFNDDIAIPAGMFSACQLINSVTINADILSIGERGFSACRALPILNLPATVTSIGNYAFASCTSFTSFTIPSSVTSLGERAFNGCTSLTSVIFPENPGFTTIPIYCFEGCTLLTSATIPSNVTNINSYAFYNCGFTTLPSGWGRSGITYGSYVFKGCPVTSLTFPDTMTSVPANFCKEWTGLETVVLGSGITSIGNDAFNGCTHLSSVTLNSGLETIGDTAFKKCTSLGTITLPSSLTTLGTYVFDNCTSLSSVAFDAASTLATISAYCFVGCTSLGSFSCPPSVATIQNNAFDGCTSLASVVLPTNPSFTTISRACFQNCTSLTSADIPSNVTTIVYEAFKNCGFTAPPVGWDRSGITYQGATDASAFMGCPITSITFPANWTSVPNYFCCGWNMLEQVDFGSGVTAIGQNAFSGCAALTDGSRIDVSNITNFGSRCFYKSKLTSLPTGINRSGISVGEGIFMDAKSLTSVNLSNWTETPYQCFRGCTAITDVDLSGAVSLGGYTFCDCTSLASVSLGSSLTSCATDVYNGVGTVAITIRATTPPTSSRITNTPSTFDPTFYVPAASVDTYKETSPWSTYAERILAITD